MRYFDWIRAKKEGQLTVAENQAYQHEWTDNPTMRAEEEALEMVDNLLDLGAKDFSPANHRSPVKIKSPELSWLGPAIGIIILGSAIGLSLLFGQPKAEVEENKREWGPRFLDPDQWIPEQDVPMANLEIPEYTEPVKAITPVAKPSLRTAQPAVVAVVEQESASRDVVVSQVTIDSGGKMSISAKQTITLKAGFHAKPGSTFVASVDEE